MHLHCSPCVLSHLTENIWRQFQNDWKLQEMPAEMIWQQTGLSALLPQEWVHGGLICQTSSHFWKQVREGCQSCQHHFQKIIGQLSPPAMWLKMGSFKVCFEFLLSVHTLDHWIYVNNLPSGITKANTFTLQWAKDNLLDCDHCCFSGGVTPGFLFEDSSKFCWPVQISRNWQKSLSWSCQLFKNTWCFVSLAVPSFK